MSVCDTVYLYILTEQHESPITLNKYPHSIYGSSLHVGEWKQVIIDYHCTDDIQCNECRYIKVSTQYEISHSKQRTWGSTCHYSPQHLCTWCLVVWLKTGTSSIKTTNVQILTSPVTETPSSLTRCNSNAIWWAILYKRCHWNSIPSSRTKCDSCWGKKICNFMGTLLS